MNKKIVIIGIVVTLIFVNLSGCNEESSSKLSVSQSIDNFAITLDDLPDGYYFVEEDFNDTIYGAVYGYQPTPFFADNISYPLIVLSIAKFDSINDTIIFYQNATSANFTSSLNDTTPKEVDLIGDESKYKLYQGESEYYSYENMSISYLQFRINNFCVMFYISGSSDPNIDYIPFTYDLAKIVEDRILKSMD